MVEGRVFTFIAGVLICGAIVLYIKKAQKGIKFEFRPMPSLDAIDEAIGRAVEMGKSVHFTPGPEPLTGPKGGPTMFAGFDFLAYIAEKSARMDVNFIDTTGSGDVQTVSEEIVRHAYARAGRSDAFSIDKVRYLSTDQWAYASEVADILRTEQVQANIMIGYFGAESLVIAESGHQNGAIQIAGTTNTYQMPFFVAACDYVFIGEEVIAGAAYLSGNPVDTGALVGEDFGKVLSVVLILVGAVLKTFNVDVLAQLLKK